MRFLIAPSRRFGTSTALCVAVATFAALAATASGFPVQHVSLNDGGIWVTDNSIGTVGRFDQADRAARRADRTAASSTSVDVVQDGPVVAVYDASGGRDVPGRRLRARVLDGGVAISPAPAIALGGSTLAVLGTNQTLRTTTLSADGGSLAGCRRHRPGPRRAPAG